jgi:hypothetical protein
MAGTAEKNNRPTLVAGEVATRARPPVNGARDQMVPRQVDGSSLTESTTALFHGSTLHA